MSTADLGARVEMPARATASMALVPLAGARQLVPGATRAPTNAMLWVFVVGYGGLATICAADLLAPWMGWAVALLYAPGVLCTMVTGAILGLYTVWKPTERKFRQAMVPAVVFVATVATSDLRTEFGTEAFASSRVTLLAPVADAVLRSGRIEVLGVGGSWAEINEYWGDPQTEVYSLQPSRSARMEPSSGRSASSFLDDVLRTEGVSRAEYDRITAVMTRAGVDRVLARPGHVSFRFGQNGSTYLVYARPGQPLASTTSYLERTTMRRTPLGDGWYLLRR
ncbi:MAG TPA: hypothetical protein VGB24_18335 [Longimicrobium sp.]|jgi:uncharacterized membrane protein YdcZ (DUF606 family)|uniref:hypothetical protein n=1 Tax=Longimicrobium sp. TaxID=2029185 RepID=UPI002EDB0D03